MKADISRSIGAVLLISLVFYHIGPNYHITFGSFGLGVMLYLSRNLISLWSAACFLLGGCLISLSYLVYVVNYESGATLQVFRMALNAAVLCFLVVVNTRVEIPSSKLIILCVMVVVFPIYYQFTVDPFFKISASFVAMADANHVYLRDLSDFKDLVYLRPVSIYLEPSSSGMVLACLAILGQFCKKNERLFLNLMILSALFMLNSLLGYLSVFGVYFYFLVKGADKQQRKYILLFGVLLSVLGLYYMILGRTLETGIDVSAMARIVNPFILIYENLKSNDFFGIPINSFEHFRYLNIYDDMSNYPGHNGLLSLLIGFGLSGLIILLLVFGSVNGFLSIFIILIIFSQNGNFLSYEKVFLATYMLAVTRSINKKNDSGVNNV
jgi:hypothetical protein